MNWKELGKKIASLGLPALGMALGGPGGAAMGSIIASSLGLSDATPEAIAKAVATNPDNIIKLRELEVQEKVRLREIAAQQAISFRQADSSDIAAVNATMQAESKSEHWTQFSWRPYNGFMFGTTMFGCYFVLPIMERPVPDVPFEAWAAWGAILGVASWWRGKAKKS